MKITVYTKEDCDMCDIVKAELMDMEDVELTIKTEDEMPDNVRDYITNKMKGAMPAVVVDDSEIIVPAKMVVSNSVLIYVDGLEKGES